MDVDHVSTYTQRFKTKLMHLCAKGASTSAQTIEDLELRLAASQERESALSVRLLSLCYFGRELRRYWV